MTENSLKCHHCNTELTVMNGLHRVMSMDREQAPTEGYGKVDMDSRRESKETEEKEEKEAPSFRGIYRAYTEDASIHGLKYTMDRGRHWFFRILWVLLGFLALATLVGLLWTLYLSYSKYPVKTVVSLKPTDHLPFPAVTICNLNPFEASKVKNLDSGGQNLSAALTTLQLAHSLFKDRLNFTAEMLLKEIPMVIMNETFEDIVQQVLPDLDSTMVACFWEGREENCASLFKPLDLEFQRCFQFNGDLGVQRRVSTHSGLSSGLHVLVDIRQEDYFFNEALSAGIQVLLHDPGELPDVINEGFLASPGFSTIARVVGRKYHYLPAPFKAFGERACVADAPRLDAVSSGMNVTYTVAMCVKICLDNRSQAACGCRLSNSSFTYDPTLPLCKMRDVYSCYKRLVGNFRERAREMACDCPRLCDTTQYTEITSLAYFPSDATLHLLHRIGVIDNTSSRKNYVDLKIFYDDLVFHEVSHVAEYTLDSILGTLGGNMGLFVGASLLSIVEVVELLYRLLCHALQTLRGRQQTHIRPRVKA